MINPHTPLWQLTVGEYVELNKSIFQSFIGEKKCEYGLIGLARILGCSKATASRIKNSGILDEAITQYKNTIIIDKEKVLQIMKEQEGI